MARQHSSRTLARARELAATGVFNAAEIQRALKRELGVDVHHSTIRSWTDPQYATRRARRSRDQLAHRRTGRGRRLRYWNLSPIAKFRRMQALREIGLSHGAIARVMNLDFDAGLSESNVRYALDNEIIPQALRHPEDKTTRRRRS